MGAEPPQHSPAALIYAALFHNKLQVEEGFSVFDLDEDQKLSFQDLLLSCNQLELGISQDDLRSFHRSAADGTDFITLQGWTQALRAPDGLDAVLESRGLLPNELPPATAALSVQEMLGIVKAALSYNSLSVEEGFAYFDADQDGMISHTDLRAAVTQLQLGISASDLDVLYGHLDSGKNGRVDKASWVALVELWSVVVQHKLVAADVERIDELQLKVPGNPQFNDARVFTDNEEMVMAESINQISLCGFPLGYEEAQDLIAALAAEMGRPDFVASAEFMRGFQKRTGCIFSASTKP